MSGTYYYVIAGLPELRLDDYKEPYRVREFVSEISEQVSVRHLEWINDIVRQYDHPSLVQAVLGTESFPGDPRGAWKYAAVREQVRQPETEFPFPDYVRQFLADIRRFQQQEIPLTRRMAEERLTVRYYSYMRAHPNRFLREFFNFDFLLRNVLAALSQRECPVVQDAVVWPDTDDIGIRLQQSQASDFGLSRELDFLPELLDQWHNPDWLHREKYVDTVRWQRVEQINLFHYFDVDVLLGYLVRLMLVERWIDLDELRGRDVLAERSEVKERVSAGEQSGTR